MNITQVYIGGKEFVNAFIVTSGKSMIIDTGNPGSTGKILKALTDLNIDRKDVSLILITHAHRDHYGSVSELKELIKAPVAIQQLDADYIRNGYIAPIIPTSLKAILTLPFTSRGRVEPVSPDIIFDKELDLRQFNIEGKAISTPGHTNGSSSVILEKECIVGDLLMFKAPFNSIPALPLYAMDKALCLNSIYQLEELSVDTVYSGHGGPWSMEEVRRRIFQ